MPTRTHDKHWVSTWVAAAMPLDIPLYALKNDFTIRQTVRLPAISDGLRVVLSNEVGNEKITILGATVAHTAVSAAGITPGSPRIIEGTLNTLSFAGSRQKDLDPGTIIVSDEIFFVDQTKNDVTISIHLAGSLSPSSKVTGHLEGKTDTWICPGDATLDESMPSSFSVHQSLLVTAVHGWLPRRYGSIACFGDSITDRGDSALPYNYYLGWIDGFQFRLDKAQIPLSVLNLGISGDSLTGGGMKRFKRDALDQLDVRYVFVHIGVNDIGLTPATVEDQDDLYRRITSAYRQIVSEAHGLHLHVVGSTIMPFLSPPMWPTPWPFAHPIREANRKRLNEWIRMSKTFDHLVDFSAAVTDPQNPDRIRQEYQVSDFLHPSAEGYVAMARAIDLSIFGRAPKGVLHS